MKHTNARACLSIALLRYVRDERPSPDQFIAWLGADAGRYHVLRKAGMLCVQDDQITLSPHHCTLDGRGFRVENELFLLDEDRVLIFRR